MSKKNQQTPDTDTLRDEAIMPEAAQEAPEAKSSRIRLFSSLLSEDEEKQPEVRRLRDALRALSINGQWFKQQIGVICLIVLGVIIYITNRYKAQQEMMEEDRLRRELLDWKYRSITRRSELTFRTRQTKLEDMLNERGDSTLKPGKTAPFILINK